MDESIEKFKTMYRQKKPLVLLLRSEESVIMTIIFQFFKMTKKSNLKRLSFFTIPNSFFCNRAKKFEKTVLSYCHARCHQLWPRSSTTAIINIIEKRICKLSWDQNRYFFNHFYNINYMHLWSGPNLHNATGLLLWFEFLSTLWIDYRLITGIDEQVLNLQTNNVYKVGSEP